MKSIAFLLLAMAACRGQHTWVSLKPPNDTRNFGGVAWNGGLFAAVGSGGMIHTSPDGLAWDSAAFPGERTGLSTVIWDGERFVAVGSKGRILASADGRTWADLPSPTRMDLSRIIHRQSRYLIGGDSGTVCVSTDLKNWAVPVLPTRADVISLVGNDTLFLAFTLDGMLLKSPDGRNWSGGIGGPADSQGKPYLVFHSLWNSGYFYAGTSSGRIARSADGTEWENLASLPISGFGAICRAGNRFLGLGVLYGDIWSSDDGGTWRKEHAPNQHGWHGLHCDEERIVAVGNTRRRYFSREGSLWQSTWTGENPFIQGAAASESLAVGVGDAGNVFRSRDGRTWQVSGSLATVGLEDVAYTGNRFIAAGARGMLLSSRDGLSWNREESPVGLGLHAIAKLDGALYAVGDSAVILRSDDGTRWELQFRFAAAPALRDLAAGGGVIVAVGDYGRIMYRGEMGGWQTAPRVTDKDIGSVAWNQGLFLAAGDNGRLILGSPDGIKWTATPIAEGGPSISRIGVAGGRFIGLSGEDIYSRSDSGQWVREYQGTTSIFATALSFRGEDFVFGSTDLVMRVPAPSGVRARSGRVTGRGSRSHRLPVFGRPADAESRDARGRLTGP